MGMMLKRNGLTILKLGGSLITNKDRPLSPNFKAMRIAGRAISSALEESRKLKLFLIHGGGSFGHYYASMFHATTTPGNVAGEGVSRVAQAMISLHSMILNELIEADVPCRTIAPGEFLASPKGKVTRVGSNKISALLNIGCVPISFGDIVTTNRGTWIVSGDQIALSVAKNMNVERVIFAMDVDGIFEDSKMKGPIIREMNSQNQSLVKKRKFDVTGGIGSKIEIGFKLARLGSDVYFVNGKDGERLQNLLSGEHVLSTHIVSKSISS
jgi:isopentenyl phosphate kinase